MTNEPLVSICIVTYNSADTILETLESASNQTYKNIELIVSDDCSSDETVTKCVEWLENHSTRFVRTNVITSNRNTGISANYNRAIDNAAGDWIKTIDGDDILHEDCIQSNMDYVKTNPNARVVFSDYVRFSINKKGEKIEQQVDCTSIHEDFYNSSPEKQYQQLLFRNFLPSYSVFFEGKLVKEYRYDERFKYIEDEPLWVRLTGDGVKIWAFPKVTSYYRIAESVSKSSQRFYSTIFYETYQKYFWEDKFYRIKECNLEAAYDQNKKYLLFCDMCNVLFSNKRTWFSFMIMRAINIFIKKCITFKLV